jgi:cytochrome b pre-mRNA-processing protein 3
MLSQLLRRSPAKRSGELLHDSAVRQARSEWLYVRMGAPDTIEGRFELLTLHVILLIDRLRGEAGSGADARQALFDAYVSNLDGAIREMGVGDLAVGKRMRKLGEAFYGRAHALDKAFATLPDTRLLDEILARTVLQGASEAQRASLSAYVVRCRDRLRDVDIRALLDGGILWPTI